MPQKRLVSPDGRRVVLAAGGAEIARLEDAGYVVPSARRAKPETANSGAEGHRRARASSTTEGQERNTGSTVEAPANTKAPVDEDPLEPDEGDEGDEGEQPKVDEPAAKQVDAEKAAAARVAARAAARPAARKPTTR